MFNIRVKEVRVCLFYGHKGVRSGRIPVPPLGDYSVPKKDLCLEHTGIKTVGGGGEISCLKMKVLMYYYSL